MKTIYKDKFLILEYVKGYDQQYGKNELLVEEEIREWLKKNRYLNKDKFMKIALWKSKRPKKHYEKNDDKTIIEVTKFSFGTNSEIARIKSLFILSGVSWPVASVILHFAFPNRYPILDFRVIYSLGLRQPTAYTFNFWKKYCRILHRISKMHNLPLRMIDKALWYYSKQNQK